MRGLCSHCQEEAAAKVVDIGVGNYEYWGSKGVHTCLVVVSDCCEEEIRDLCTGEPITMEEFQDWEIPDPY